MTSAENKEEPAYTRATQRIARHLGNRWTRPILEALQAGPLRFSEIKRASAPVSQRMLTLSLRKLEKDGLIFRTVSCDKPPQVTYGLTTFGTALADRLVDFDRWVRGYCHLLSEVVHK